MDPMRNLLKELERIHVRSGGATRTGTKDLATLYLRSIRPHPRPLNIVGTLRYVPGQDGYREIARRTPQRRRAVKAAKRARVHA